MNQIVKVIHQIQNLVMNIMNNKFINNFFIINNLFYKLVLIYFFNKLYLLKYFNILNFKNKLAL